MRSNLYSNPVSLNPVSNWQLMGDTKDINKDNPTMGVSQGSLSTLFLIGFVCSVLLAIANSVSPFVTWSVLVICMLTTGLGLMMLFLLDGAGKQDPDSPQVVASLPDEVSANQVVSLLHENGIKATIVGSYTSGFQTEVASDVQVVVPLKEAVIAKDILDKK